MEKSPHAGGTVAETPAAPWDYSRKPAVSPITRGITKTGFTPAMGGSPVIKPQPFITPEQVREMYGSVKWTWPLWIPAGHITLLVGAQSVGKSYLLARLMATFCGAMDTWPDGEVFEGKPGTVLLCDTEEMRGAYGERLQTMGVPDAGWFLPGSSPTYTSKLPKDIVSIEALAMEHKSSVIIIDSLSGGHAMDENSAAMRIILQKLTVVAGTLQIPIIVAHHVNKRNPLQPIRITLDRIRGSSTISQFARSVVGLYRLQEGDLEAPVRVEAMKCTFCKPPEAFGFTINDKGIEFHDAPEEQKPETATDRAAEFLQAQLDHQSIFYKDLITKGAELGISKNSLYRARESMGIVAAEGYWALPYRGT